MVDNNINLSVRVPEVGMLQPEALSQSSPLTVVPLFLITGSHVNSRGDNRQQTVLSSFLRM